MNPETISPTLPVPSDEAEPECIEARPSLLSRALLAIAVLFVLVRALPIVTCPPGTDQGLYLTIGQGLLQGKQLYRDICDDKPPGIFYLYAGIAKVFGRAMWSAAAVDILLLLLISYLLFRFTEPYLGRAGAAIAVMVHASWHGQIMYHWIAQPETFQLVCVLASYLLMMGCRRLSRKSWFAAGLLLGCGFWLKYNAIAFLPFLLFLPYLDTSGLDREPRRLSLAIPWRDWLERAALLLAGLAAAIGIVLAWIVFHGAWPAMREEEFGVLGRYAALGFQRNPDYLLSVFVRTNYFLGESTLWVTLAALLVAWIRRDLRRFAPVFLAALAAYAAALMQVRLHDYYFQTCYPFFAAIWAYFVVSSYEVTCLLARDLRKRGWRVAAVLIWVVFANAMFLPLPDEFSKLRMRYEELAEWRADPEAFYSVYPHQLQFNLLRGQLRVLHYLEKNAQASDGVFLWGYNCAIYYFSGHQPPTRFVSTLGFVSLWCPPSYREELVRGLRKSQPRFIIVTRGDALPSITYSNLDSESYLKFFPKLSSFITKNYEPVADLDTFVVYRRNDLPQR